MTPEMWSAAGLIVSALIGGVVSIVLVLINFKLKEIHTSTNSNLTEVKTELKDSRAEQAKLVAEVSGLRELIASMSGRSSPTVPAAKSKVSGESTPLKVEIADPTIIESDKA